MMFDLVVHWIRRAILTCEMRGVSADRGITRYECMPVVPTTVWTPL